MIIKLLAGTERIPPGGYILSLQEAVRPLGFHPEVQGLCLRGSPEGISVAQITSVPSKDALAKVRLEAEYEPSWQRFWLRMDGEFKALK